MWSVLERMPPGLSWREVEEVVALSKEEAATPPEDAEATVEAPKGEDQAPPTGNL